jgi:phosphotransacetylase
MASFFESLIKRASESIRTIVLPEGNDERIHQSAAEIVERQFAKVVVIGDIPLIEKGLKKFGADPSSVEIVDPKTDPRRQAYAQSYFEYRKHKGVTLEQADQAVQQTICFGTMMVQLGDADGLVAGACHSTADTLRPARKSSSPPRASPRYPACSLCAGRTRCFCLPIAA